MRAIKLLTLMIAVFALTGCTKFKDGKYIVIDIKSKDEALTTLTQCNGDTINGKSINVFLQEKFFKRKYQLTVKNDFVVLTDLEEGEDNILAKTNDSLGDFFSTDISKGEGKEQFHIQLRQNESREGLVLIVDLTVPERMAFRPVQLGGKLLGSSYCGRAICYLSKLD